MTKYGKLLLLISALDMVITGLGIYFGIIDEANIIMKWHIEKGGILLFASVKMLITALAILFFETVWEKEQLQFFGKKQLMRREVLKKYYIGSILLYIFIYMALTILIHKNLIWDNVNKIF